MAVLKKNKISNLVARFEEYAENNFIRGAERVFYRLSSFDSPPPPAKKKRGEIVTGKIASVPQVSKEIDRSRKQARSRTHSSYSDYMQVAQSFQAFAQALEAPLFREHLRDLIEEKGYKKDSHIYKKSGISKHVFSKIMNFRANPPHRPSKETVAALCMGLELTIGEAELFYAIAGYSLTKSDFIDKVIRFFIEMRNYNIFEINSLINYYNKKDKPSKLYPFIGEQVRE